MEGPRGRPRRDRLPARRAMDHYEGWEDAAVPPERLGAYLRDFQALLDRYGYDTSMYGHFGQGLVHCRINFDLRSPGGIADYRAFLDEVASLVVAHGGSLSGEHGDGQSQGRCSSTSCTARSWCRRSASSRRSGIPQAC